MKPETSERLFVEGLFNEAASNKKISDGKIVNIEKLTGDASTRRYYRVFANKISYVACLDEPNVKEDDENTFLTLQKVYCENNIRVPKIYDFDLSKGFILEEDLGDEILLKTLGQIDKSKEVEYYKKVIDELIKIHSINPKKYEANNFVKLAFDEDKLMGECLFTMEFFIGRFLGNELSTKDRSLIVSSLVDICTKISEQKMVITHRDFHSRNVMLKGDELVIIDFQDTRMGIPQYDLVSLLQDCYFSLSKKNVDTLKEYYWDSFLKEKELQTHEEFHYYYDLMAIQRIFKAIGTFCFIFFHRGDKRYLKYVGYGFENLRKFLSKHPEHAKLKSLLTSMYYEN